MRQVIFSFANEETEVLEEEITYPESQSQYQKPIFTLYPLILLSNHYNFGTYNLLSFTSI